MLQLDTFLSSLVIGSAQSVAELTMFPLLRQPAPAPWYDTLTDGIAAGTARVTEISEMGSVAELRVVNEGRRHLLLVDGEELVGAKQNRIVNLTILVPPTTSLIIPVSCVEAGRWRHESSEFRPAAQAFHAVGRSAKLRQVSASLRARGAATSDQGAIWDEIAAKADRLGAPSPTGAAAAMYDRQRGQLDAFVSRLQPVEGQVGAVFAIRGRIAGLDAFDVPRTWQAFMPKLVRSYGLDAVDAGIAGDAFAEPSPRRFLDAIADAPGTQHRAVGEGLDLRADGRGVVAAALATTRGIVHAVAFPAAGDVRPGQTRAARRFDTIRSVPFDR